MNRAIKVPVIMQMEALECGAASLAMILAYYGRWIPLETARLVCGVSRDGSNAKNIIKAAQAFGLAAKAYRLEPESFSGKKVFPCIVHWDFSHFVVLRGLTEKYAYINDPAKGEIKVPRDEFNRSFTGIAITFSLTDEFVKEGKPASLFTFLKKRLQNTASILLFLLILSIIGFGAGLLSPTFSRVFADLILPRTNPQLTAPFFLLLAVSTALLILIQYLQAEYLLKINGKLAVSANASFMWHVLRLPMSFFSQRQPGEVAVRRVDNESIASSVMGKLAPLLINLGAVVVYLVIMFRYSLPLTLIAIFSLCVNFFFSRFIAKKQANISRVRLRDEGLKQSAAVSGIKMIETLKASGAEEGFFEKWSGLQAAVNTSEAKAFQIASLWGSIPGFITQLSNFAVLAVGIYLCMNGWFTVGLLFAFQSYMSQISAPAASIISVGSMFSELRVKMERILDVMKYEPDVPETIPEAESYEKLNGEIELKNVTFGYSKLSEPIIKDFSISVKKGQRVAIVGTSGCGKSTVSKLITGLYEPWSGSITYDGKNRNEINRHVFTSSITVVDQDITLFGDTIAANIKMWDGSIDDSDMISAARDSKLHTVIMERDGGYDYKMADGGRDFSGGQCQRLEITRALAGSPTLIILDEATSALDAKTEFDVISAIKGRGITCIIIAHRLSTIRDCDEIIVLDKGVIVERGTHEQLMKQGGRYNDLISNE